VETVATATKDGWRISGTKSFVIDGHTADLLIVAARTSHGVSLFLVPGDASGLTRTRLETMDMTRKQAKLDLPMWGARRGAARCRGARAGRRSRRFTSRPWSPWPPSRSAVPRSASTWRSQYAKDRHQFGRPIGSFQAIKHKCADMLVQVESAKAAAYYAGWAVSEGRRRGADGGSRSPSPTARRRTSTVPSENIQIHGGIGFTWEHDAHLYFKRAKSSELMFGSPSAHRKVLADRLGI
jgi:alkylation response protein AidB-like acyl-CoA dehydrogenase